MGVYKRAREYTKNELVNKGRAITQRTYEYIKGTRVHRGQSNIKRRSNRARGYTNRAHDYTKGMRVLEWLASTQTGHTSA